MTMTGAAAALPSPIDRELVLLETLRSLLQTAIGSLSAGEGGILLEVSQHIRSTAEEVTSLSAQLGHLPATPQAQQERSRLLAELGQQRAFCGAMLRRWRRSLVLRRQLLGLGAEPAPYTESLQAGWY